MKLIVGLGNPGEQYIGTRHNLGFEMLEEFRKKNNLPEWEVQSKFKSEIIKVEELILARPLTHMNLSGIAVRVLADFYKVSPSDIIVIHDDLDLISGKIKVRLGGGGGGHHGVESVIEQLGTDQFIRVRLGIGNQKAFAGEHKRVSFNAERFVLERFTSKERSEVKQMIKQAMKALELVFDKGIDAAQNQFN